MNENKQPNQKQDNAHYGVVDVGKMYFRQFVGDATAPDGKKFELCQAMDGSPKVCYKNRIFRLPWNDICNLVAEAGLFDEGGEQ